MKKFSLVLSLIAAAFSSGTALAGVATPCPTSFDCAFGAGEVRPLSDPNTPGSPGTYAGYIAFNSSGVPTMYVVGDNSGAFQALKSFAGTCTAGNSTTSAPGTLDFTANSGPKFAFVSDSSGTELRVLLTADSGNVTPSSINLGTCSQM